MRINIFSKIFTTGIVISTIGLVSGCYYDKAELLYPNSYATVDCGAVSAKFTADVNPIIQSKCAISGCHNASAAGGVTLLNYTQINSAKDRVNATAVTIKSMPPDGPLSVDERSKIKCWIDAGALNN